MVQGLDRVTLDNLVATLPPVGRAEVTAGEVRGVGELVRDALASVSKKGLDSMGTYKGHPGEMSLPRAQEVAAAVNRIRPLRAAPKT